MTNTKGDIRLMMELLTWSDGTKSLIEIADIYGVPVWELYSIVDVLVSNGLLTLSHKQLAKYKIGSNLRQIACGWNLKAHSDTDFSNILTAHKIPPKFVLRI